MAFALIFLPMLHGGPRHGHPLESAEALAPAGRGGCASRADRLRPHESAGLQSPSLLARPGSPGQARPPRRQRPLPLLLDLLPPATSQYRQERSNRVFVRLPPRSSSDVMSLVAWSQHLGLIWVAIEATTLVDGSPHLLQPLEAQHRGHLEVPPRLLGRHRPRPPRHLLPGLLRACQAGSHAQLDARGPRACAAPGLSKPWLRAAFVLLLVGYGTKMGLAPMHTWKPDAYGEAPGVVGAVFAGWRHQLRLPRLPPRLPDLRGRGRGRLRLEAPPLHGPLLDGGGRPLHDRPAGLQAHARLLQRRAHGHPRARPGHRRRPPSTALCSTWPPTRRPRACSSSRPATSIEPTPARAATRSRGALRRLPLSGAPSFSRGCSR